MVADLVMTARNGTCELGMPGNALADTEEGCPRAVGVEYVEHARGDLRIRAVVDGDGHCGLCPRVRGEMRPVRSQPPAPRPEPHGSQQKVIRHDRRQCPRPPVWAD